MATPPEKSSNKESLIPDEFEMDMFEGFEDDQSNVSDITDIIPDEDGGVEIVFSDEDIDDEEYINPDASEHNANLALYLDEDTLGDIKNYCQERYEEDKISNREFHEQIASGMERLGLTIEKLDDPFPGASPVTHPLILEAALKNQAKITGEVFNGKNFVDTYLITERDPNTVDIANRVRNYMDYQYLYQMKEYIPETEKLAFRYGLTGNAFRKYYFDPIRQRCKTRYLTEDKFVINSAHTTLEDADFYTELLDINSHEFEHLVELGEYKDLNKEYDEDGLVIGGLNDVSNDLNTEESGLRQVNLPFSPGHDPMTEFEDEINHQMGETFGHSSIGSNNFVMREYHCYLKLPSPFNDGVERSLPYVVTAEDSTGQIVSIRRNWKNTDALMLKRVWYSHYKLIPGLGFHGLGYIHILGNFQFALTQILRSLIDSGQFANLQGGFVAKGIRFTADRNRPLKLGEYRELDTGGRPIKDALMPMQWKEPSQVLERLISFLDARAGKFADTTDQVLADSTNYGPVGTTVALLEAATKFTSGILKRFYNSLKDEFRILHDLNYDTIEDQEDFYVKGERMIVKRDDFSGILDLMPAADPNLSSSSHRIAVAQTKLSAAQQAPNIHDMREAYREFYAQMGEEPESIERRLPNPEQAQELDPVSDIIAASQGKPIKAFPGQNHQAHIDFKSAFLADPKGGGQELAAALVPIIEANIKEHALMLYLDGLKGVIDTENGGSSDAASQANAAIRLQQLHKAETLTEGLEAGDPATMLAMAELKKANLDEKELEHKKEIDYGKLAAEDRRLTLKQFELINNAEKDYISKKMDMEMDRIKIGSDMLVDALKSLKEPNK